MEKTLPQSPSTASGVTEEQMKTKEQTGGEERDTTLPTSSGLTEEQSKSSGDQTRQEVTKEEHTGVESSGERERTLPVTAASGVTEELTKSSGDQTRQEEHTRGGEITGIREQTPSPLDSGITSPPSSQQQHGTDSSPERLPVPPRTQIPGVESSGEQDVVSEEHTGGGEITVIKEQTTVIPSPPDSGITSPPSQQQHGTDSSPPVPPRSSPNLTQIPPSRDTEEIKKWRIFVKRCHEVIAILTGFVMVFAPVNFLIKTVRNNGGNQVQPAAIVELMVMSFLEAYKKYVVYPFLLLGIAYGLLYTASAASFAMIGVLIADILSIMLGFFASFYLVYFIWEALAMGGGISCGVLLVVLFCLLYPRERVRVPRDVASRPVKIGTSSVQ